MYQSKSCFEFELFCWLCCFFLYSFLFFDLRYAWNQHRQILAWDKTKEVYQQFYGKEFEQSSWAEPASSGDSGGGCGGTMEFVYAPNRSCLLIDDIRWDPRDYDHVPNENLGPYLDSRPDAKVRSIEAREGNVFFQNGGHHYPSVVRLELVSMNFRCGCSLSDFLPCLRALTIIDSLRYSPDISQLQLKSLQARVCSVAFPLTSHPLHNRSAILFQGNMLPAQETLSCGDFSTATLAT